jgi:hypothetical protein
MFFGALAALEVTPRFIGKCRADLQKTAFRRVKAYGGTEGVTLEMDTQKVLSFFQKGRMHDTVQVQLQFNALTPRW